MTVKANAREKTKVGFVLSDKLIQRIKIRAAERRMIPSHLVEELLTEALKRPAKKGEPEEIN